MNNLYPTKESQKLDNYEKWDELVQECLELSVAINKSDIRNIGEEVMDVIQWGVNILHSYNLDFNKELIKHQSKLLHRGHEFILPHEDKIKHVIEGNEKLVKFR